MAIDDPLPLVFRLCECAPPATPEYALVALYRCALAGAGDYVAFGRGEEHGISVPAVDQSVSETHGVLLRETEGGLAYHDKSRNGTWVEVGGEPAVYALSAEHGGSALSHSPRFGPSDTLVLRYAPGHEAPPPSVVRVAVPEAAAQGERQVIAAILFGRPVVVGTPTRARYERGEDNVLRILDLDPAAGRGKTRFRLELWWWPD